MKKTPFTLDNLATEYYFVEIIPKYKKFMAGISARSLSTARKLLAALQQLEGNDEVWGLNLAKNYGLLVSERMAMKETENRRKSIGEYLGLLGRVHEETKIPVEQLQEYFAEPFKHTAVLKDYLGEISSVYSRLKDDNDQTELITVMLKERIIPTWQLSDTTALHEKIYDDLVVYVEREQSGWEEVVNTEDENAPMLGEAGRDSSVEESPNLKTTETRTGELFTTIS
jgi:hypothetical protein